MKVHLTADDVAGLQEARDKLDRLIADLIDQAIDDPAYPARQATEVTEAVADWVDEYRAELGDLAA